MLGIFSIERKGSGCIMSRCICFDKLHMERPNCALWIKSLTQCARNAFLCQQSLFIMYTRDEKVKHNVIVHCAYDFSCQGPTQLFFILFIYLFIYFAFDSFSQSGIFQCYIANICHTDFSPHQVCV